MLRHLQNFIGDLLKAKPGKDNVVFVDEGGLPLKHRDNLLFHLAGFDLADLDFDILKNKHADVAPRLTVHREQEIRWANSPFPSAI